MRDDLLAKLISIYNFNYVMCNDAGDGLSSVEILIFSKLLIRIHLIAEYYVKVVTLLY